VIYIPPGGGTPRVTPAAMPRTEANALRRAARGSRGSAARPQATASGPRPGPCGCTAGAYCEQHLQALAPAQRRAWRRWQQQPAEPKDLA
jgi:hypothetical protein